MFTEDYLGKVLDRRYRIVETIGVGGIAHVFRADHVGTGRSLAVKVLKSEFSTNIEFIRRFQREAWLTAKLAHDNVVEVLDVQTEGACYLVMELLGGSDLRTYLRRSGPLPWAQVRPIMLQICGALQCAHDHGVVHRDLKPANCFRLEPSGRIKVLDFGIARPLSPQEHDGKITMTGALMGTPEYMAPEQFLGEFDARSDIYSAGVIMFELLAGRRPFTSRGAELMQQIMKSPPPALARVRADLDCPSRVEAVVSRVLAKRPDARYATMREFAQAIAECDATPSDSVESDTSTVTLPFSPRKPPRRTLVGMPLLAERACAPASQDLPPASAAPPHAESEPRPAEPSPEGPLAPEPEPGHVEPDEPTKLAPARSPADSETTEHATATVPRPAVARAASPPEAAAIRASTRAPSGPAPTLTMVHRRLGLRIVVLAIGALAGAAVVLPRLAPFLVAPRFDVSATKEGPPSTAGKQQQPRLAPPVGPEPNPLVISAESSDAPSRSRSPASGETRLAVHDEPRPARPPPSVEEPGPPPAAIEASAPPEPSPEAERRARRRTAEDAIRRILKREKVGSSVSRIHVTARFSPDGEMIELNLHDGLPRGAERERLEASLRKLRLSGAGAEVLVDRPYDLPLPE